MSRLAPAEELALEPDVVAVFATDVPPVEVLPGYRVDRRRERSSLDVLTRTPSPTAVQRCETVRSHRPGRCCRSLRSNVTVRTRRLRRYAKTRSRWYSIACMVEIGKLEEGHISS